MSIKVTFSPIGKYDVRFFRTIVIQHGGGAETWFTLWAKHKQDVVNQTDLYLDTVCKVTECTGFDNLDFGEDLAIYVKVGGVLQRQGSKKMGRKQTKEAHNDRNK